jgi:acyl carrier protein
VQPREGLVDDIQSVLRDHLNVLVDSPDVDLLESGLVDSVGLVELILQLEKHFEVTLPMDALEIDDFRSMHTIADLITRLSSVVLAGSGMDHSITMMLWTMAETLSASVQQVL